MAHVRPHFIHIGPEKTGTSWMYRMLSQHPDVHVAPLKEIRYFFEAHAYPKEGLVDRFRPSDWHNRYYRDYLRRRLRQYSRHPWLAARSLDRLTWDWKFLFGRRSDDWFEDLFRCEDSKIAGDFTPQTFHIPPQHIFRMAHEWPATKILLTLRDPIEWTWSFARMSLIKDRELADISDTELRDFCTMHATYYPNLSQIGDWEAQFAGRFHLIFFDEMVADPARLLHRVCEFIGLATSPIANFEGLTQSKNPGRALPMPPRVRRMLIDLYQNDVRRLAERYGGYPRRWLERYSQDP